MSPRRLLLKLSGEALMGDEGPFSPDEIERLVRVLSAVDAELGIVVGGGNILRGARGGWLDRIDADEVGMLATVLNGLVLRDYLEKSGREAIVQSAVATGFTAPIDPRKARKALEEGAIVIFAGGTGNPLVTTDTAAAIRAVSIRADLL
ncbi:MAG TPA: UMP kinase, partial [Candidatus Acetothermia bacterium]|nr:UMP kinase [Candidatus Acetothermia bacterium]